MSEEFVTYQRFNNKEDLQDFAAFLQQNGIAFRVEEESMGADLIIANNDFEKDFRLKLVRADFKKANQLLEAYYKQDIDKIPGDYYLFGFSNDELMEIIRKRDEWGIFDFLLARKILKERGEEVSDAEITTIANNRLQELAQPSKSAGSWIFMGYLSAFVGGFFGLAIAYMLSLKKTLPNGERVYVYNAKDRDHRAYIIAISVVTLLSSFYYLFRKSL